jgi:hypothetical protein
VLSNLREAGILVTLQVAVRGSSLAAHCALKRDIVMREIKLGEYARQHQLTLGVRSGNAKPKART